MSLADRLNSALERNRLQPTVTAPVISVHYDSEIVITDPVEEQTETIYKTLKEGLKSAHKHESDEFDTTVIVVENIQDKIQLPMKIGTYTVDDIQKRADGHYEVHLVNGQG